MIEFQQKNLKWFTDVIQIQPENSIEMIHKNIFINDSIIVKRQVDFKSLK